MDWAWDSVSHKGTQTNRRNVKKLKDDWVWEPVKIGPGQSYGGHQKGALLSDGTYPCGFCSGKGQKPMGSMCPVCRGTGTVSVDPPTVRCAYCKGKGTEKPISNVTCTACGGKGVIHVEEPVETCSRCRGTGKELTNKLVCIKCRGKGVVTVQEENKQIYDFGQEIERLDDLAQNKPRTEREKPIGFATGSEREALRIIKELNQADAIAVGRNISPPISPAYAKQLCDALLKKRLLLRHGVLYSLTPHGEKVLE